MQKGYIINVHPLLINNNLVWDIFYLKESDNNLHCLRLFNAELSFMVAKLPTYTVDNTMMWLKRKILDTKLVDDIKIIVRNDLNDSEYFTFNKYTYFEIFHSNPLVLRKILNHLEKEMIIFYRRFDQNDIDNMSPEDYLFYKNTETPFRFTSTTTSLPNSVYNLSAKYDIPLIGGVQINSSNLSDNFPLDFYPISIDNMQGFDMQEHDIKKTIIKDDSVDFKQNVTLMSYDIETMGLKYQDHEIIAIGCGFFCLNSNVPRRSLCIISKDIISDTKFQLVNGRKQYIIKQNDDIGEYIIAKDEQDILACFVEILQEESPQIITGFNTYGFDDEFVYRRMEKYKLHDSYLQTYSYYDLSEMKEEFWFKPFTPKFTEDIAIKIDNNIDRKHKTVKSWSITTTDVYKLILKDDPKRFTQYGRGNLDSMLENYKVKNPYTGEQLAKTDMKIQEMFRLWKNNEEIYRIALYCRQDAWITGTLLINISKLSDLIELASFSHTTFSDSVFRADGVRVNNTILAYAYSENYALKDDPYKNRSKLMKNETSDKLGCKIYDSRSIKGGAVKNLDPGRHSFVVALDLASAYPSAREASSIDSSSRIDEDMLNNPDKYGIKIIKKESITDMYGPRELIVVDL